MNNYARSLDLYKKVMFSQTIKEHVKTADMFSEYMPARVANNEGLSEDLREHAPVTMHDLENNPEEQQGAFPEMFYNMMDPMDVTGYQTGVGTNNFFNNIQKTGAYNIDADKLADTLNEIVKVGRLEYIIGEMKKDAEELGPEHLKVANELRAINNDYLCDLLSDLIKQAEYPHAVTDALTGVLAGPALLHATSNLSDVLGYGDFDPGMKSYLAAAAIGGAASPFINPQIRKLLNWNTDVDKPQHK